MSDMFKKKDRFVVEIAEVKDNICVLKNGASVDSSVLEGLVRFEQKGAYKEGYNDGLNVKEEEQYIKGLKDMATVIARMANANIQDVYKAYDIPFESRYKTFAVVVSYILENYTPEEIISRGVQF